MNSNGTSPVGGRPDYGIDAPGVRRGMLLAGCAGVAVAIGTRYTGWLGSFAPWISGLGFVVAAYGLFMGSYMTYGSRTGKLRTREKLLDSLPRCVPATAVRPCWMSAAGAD
jgi:hypothetical protein